MRLITSCSLSLVLSVCVCKPEAAQAQLFQATLKNGDYGGGAAITPTAGVVDSADGVSFVTTEVSGRSNGLINWQLMAADRTPFRTSGTVSFCFRADRRTFVAGSILGENYGYGQFNNGQGTFTATASRVLNAPGDADDQISLGWSTWHNSVFYDHMPATRLEFDRVYRVGFAWGSTTTRFEIWIDGVMVHADNGATLPWGAATLGTGSATNFSLGNNHERGIGAYSSAAGVTFSNIRIWSGYQSSADTQAGCRSISLAGPSSGEAATPLSFEASAGGCAPAANGWTWTATGGATLSGRATRSVAVTWPAAGSQTLTATNSACSGVSGTRSVTISAAPARVVVTALPNGLVQDPDVGGAADGYTLANLGGAAATISLSRNGDFFAQSPASFTLAAGATQTIALSGLPQPAGAYRGASIPSGSGVPAGLEIPVTLLAAAPPSAPPVVTPETTRVDVAADAPTSPTGTVAFTNSGGGKMTGALVSTVPWLIPQGGLITIGSGERVLVGFTIDRARRPDASSPVGSVTGDLQLVYRGVQGGKGNVTGHDAGSISISIVTVVDTAKPAVTSSALPALGSGEVALFLAGVGHVRGSVGLFLSDLSILNASTAGTLAGLKLYYTPLGGNATQVATLSALAASQPVGFADLVKSVFGNEAQVGSLQIRAPSTTTLSVNANVFNSSNPKGTFGTTLPVLRSDRAVAPGGKLYLTGLRQDASSHTNFYLQETAGLGVAVTMDFLSLAGAVVSTKTQALGPFALAQLGSVVPEGAVAAVLTNATSSPGRFLAFATPVDSASGDTWAVADWRQQEGYPGSEPVIIPIAGALHGANSTYFRTDLAVMNIGTATAAGTLRYYNRTGEIVDRSLTLGPLESRIIPDVVTTLFGVTTDSAGHLIFTPSTGAFTITSRTYTTVINDVATFGTGVPTRSPMASLRAGDVRRIGGLEDATLVSINSARPATFRTNFALVETAGQSAAVRVTVRFTASSGLVSSVMAGSRDYQLGPRQFMLLSRITQEILGATRDAFGDLRNIQVEFAHIGGDGTVEVFISAVDNGTGDSILRVD